MCAGPGGGGAGKKRWVVHAWMLVVDHSEVRWELGFGPSGPRVEGASYNFTGLSLLLPGDFTTAEDSSREEEYKREMRQVPSRDTGAWRALLGYTTWKRGRAVGVRARTFSHARTLPSSPIFIAAIYPAPGNHLHTQAHLASTRPSAELASSATPRLGGGQTHCV